MSLAAPATVKVPVAPRSIRSVVDILQVKQKLEEVSETSEEDGNGKNDEKKDSVEKKQPQPKTPAELIAFWKKSAEESWKKKPGKAKTEQESVKLDETERVLAESQVKTPEDMKMDLAARPKSVTSVEKVTDPSGARPKLSTKNKSLPDISEYNGAQSSDVNLKKEHDNARSLSSLSRSRKSFDEETLKRAKSAKPHVCSSQSRDSSPHATERRSRTLALNKTAQDVTDRLSTPKASSSSNLSQSHKYLSETILKPARDTSQIRMSDIGVSDNFESSSRRRSLPAQSVQSESSPRRKSLPTQSVKSIIKSPRRVSKTEASHFDKLKQIGSESSEDTTKRAQSASVYVPKDQKKNDERPTKSATASGKSLPTVYRAQDIEQEAQKQSQKHEYIPSSRSFETPRIVVENEHGEMLNISSTTVDTDVHRSVSCISVLESTTDVRPSSCKSALGSSSDVCTPSVPESSTDLVQSSATDLSPSSYETVLESSTDVHQSAPKSATNVGLSSCESVIEQSANVGSHSRDSVLGSSSDVRAQSPLKVTFKESTIVSGRSQTEVKPSSQNLQEKDAVSDGSHVTPASQEAEAVEEKAAKPILPSSIMKSIQAFRRKVLAKKGIVLAELEPKEVDSVIKCFSLVNSYNNSLNAE